MTGSPNHGYIIQAATSLLPPISWVSLATNSTDPSGVLEYTDTSAPGVPARFYRFTAP